VVDSGQRVLGSFVLDELQKSGLCSSIFVLLTVFSGNFNEGMWQYSGLSWLGIDVFDAFASIEVSGIKRPSRQILRVLMEEWYD
jgi:hypothetical protein